MVSVDNFFECEGRGGFFLQMIILFDYLIIKRLMLIEKNLNFSFFCSLLYFIHILEYNNQQKILS